VRVREWRESHLLIEAVRVSCHKEHSCELHRRESVDNGLSEESTKASASGGAGNVDVAKPRKSGVVGDDASVTTQVTGTVIDAEVQ
jgi:hypothetical protein